MDIIVPPEDKVLERWGKAVESVVGDNYSYNEKSTMSTYPYMRLFDIGVREVSSDLEGDECAIEIDFQVESYARGQLASSTVKKLDIVSHRALKNMGCKRIFSGAVENIDSSIKRYVSRYTLLYTGYLIGE